jgi:hypothetical protein
MYYPIKRAEGKMKAQSKKLKRKGYSIGITEADFDKFVELHESRKQDTTRADTFTYLMNFHREMQELKPRPHVVHAKIITNGEDTP